MKTQTFKELFLASNLLSLSRILLTPFVAYGLSREDTTGTILTVVLFLIAAVTDFLDGFVARRLNQVTRLGVSLDPIADKIFAATVIILLIVYRDFPIWLAGVIVGRDLLILLAGMILLRGRDVTLPSNITGKYAFGSIALLLGAYVIRFSFGIELFTWVTLILIALSTVNYARVFVKVRAGEPVPQFDDRPMWKILRVAVSVVIAGIFCWRLIIDKLL